MTIGSSIPTSGVLSAGLAPSRPAASTDTMLLALARIDPALEGRELGPWHMVPAWVTVPLAVAVAAVLVWYFIRLGAEGVPLERRIVRRLSVGLVAFALVPLVRGLSFVHPHEDRTAFAVTWSAVLLLVTACLVLAIVDFALTARRGMHEFRDLRRQTLGGRSGSEGPRDGAE